MADLRNFEDLAQYAQQQAERITRMQSDLAELSAQARSPRGYVRARTGPGGAVQDLAIDAGAQHLSTAELTAEVMSAITAAQQEYARTADEIMSPLLGAFPTEESLAEIDSGTRRLESIAADLDRITRRTAADR